MKYELLGDIHIHGLAQLWNEEWGTIFPMRESLLEQNIGQDPNVLEDGTWVAIDEQTSTFAGYVVSKCWQDSINDVSFDLTDTGWIHTLLVSPTYRGQGIGGELLVRAERALRNQGVRNIELGNDFHMRMLPGVPETSQAVEDWLQYKGYIRDRVTYDLFRDYEGQLTEPLPQAEGLIFRLLREDEGERCVAFMRRCFSERWVYQTLVYWKLGGTGREFAIAEKDGEIIGFCRINDSHSPILAQNIYWSPLFEHELGGIGPLGIDVKYRGLGYGLDIVRAGIHFLHERGIRQIVIDSTPYVDFYGKLGYQPWRNYVRFYKELAGE